MKMVEGKRILFVEIRPGQKFPKIHVEPDASGVKPEIVFIEIDPNGDPRMNAANRYLAGLISKEELDRMGVTVGEPHVLNQAEKQELLNNVLAEKSDSSATQPGK